MWRSTVPKLKLTNTCLLKRSIPLQARFIASTSTIPTNDISIDKPPIEKIRNQPVDAPIVPINIKAVYHAPLRNPIKYGDLVAEIQLRSYDNENLDFYSDFALRVGFYLGIPLTGPKPLPTRRERWTVIKSPFVHAKSKENFERHTHKRIIKVWDTNSELIEMWISYITKHAMAGVGMKCTCLLYTSRCV